MRIANSLPSRKVSVVANETIKCSRRLKVTARLPDGSTIEARGQEGRCLLALHQAGQGGINALEMSSRALRLSAYCWSLVRNGLDIITEREGHGSGWHGRHKLLTPIQIIEIEGGDFAPAVSHG